MKFIRREDTPRGAPEAREHFTGLVGMTPLLAIEDKILVRVAHVRFEPGARTHWHTHPAGQILHVTQGTGLVQTWDERNRKAKAQSIRPGDVIYILPDVKHWHGASSGEVMEHIAHSLGGATAWLEEVSDEDYARAC